MCAGKLENGGGSATANALGKAETSSPKEENTFKNVDAVVDPWSTVAEDRDNSGRHNVVHLCGRVAVTTQFTYEFGGAGKDVLALMRHIAIEAHAHTKVLERCIGWFSGQRATFVNEVGRRLLPLAKS